MVFLAQAGPGPASHLCWCWKRQERAAKHGSVQERSSCELHKHLLGRFIKGNMKNPAKFHLLSKMCQLAMTFYFSDTAVLLFDFWNVHSPTGMVLSVLVILLLSVLYEAVKMGKAVLLRRALLALPRSLSQEALTQPQEGDSDPAQGRWFWFHVAQTLFHVVQVVLGYMVMLAVMSYNAWIFLGAIAGSTLGYFMVYPLLGRG
ncbi:protein SLC31A2 isoform X1 [Passer domesticus]|uniref:protein SLC31A2 isoform X1 n=2 Tax=Passer domesticus TaxID=48849 RepID=UPI0030FF191E